jgi:opacity protein-like surface antigen
MKKITLVALAISTLASNLSAKEVLTDIHLNGSASQAASIDSTEIGIGYGVSAYFDNHIYAGTSIDFSAGKFDNTKVYIPRSSRSRNDDNLFTAGADFKLGYAFFSDKLAIYGIGSAIYQGIAGIDGAGFGYGAGADYRITDHIALNLEYKTYSMTSNYGDYDYDKISTGIKYNF